MNDHRVICVNNTSSAWNIRAENTIQLTNIIAQKTGGLVFPIRTMKVVQVTVTFQINVNFKKYGRLINDIIRVRPSRFIIYDHP